MNKQFKVENYELQSDKVVAYLTDGDTETTLDIDRSTFERWLTNGTGNVDMGYTFENQGVITDVEQLMPIDEFWANSKEINNSPVLMRVHEYLTSTDANRAEVVQAFKLQEVFDILDNQPIDAGTRYSIKSKIAQYGGAARQWIIALGQSSNAA